MGAYLAHPITKTEPEDGQGNRLEYGASSMQGWRVSQEDAHNCVLDFDDASSFFAVYDGHGGSEVAVYLSQHLPEYLKATDSYKRGDWKEALSEAYLRIDESIRTPDVLKEIVRLSKFGKSAEDVDAHEEEDVSELFEEATMPIEMLVAKYKDGKSLLEKFVNAKLQDSSEKPGSSKALQKEAGSSAADDEGGCSTSSPSKKSITSPTSTESKGDQDEPSSSTSRLISETNKVDTAEVSSTTEPIVIKNGVNREVRLEPDSATNSSSSTEDCVRLNGEESDGIHSKEGDSEVSSNGLLEPCKNGVTIDGDSEKKSGDNQDLHSADDDAKSREESILVEPKKKKGKVHPPPVVQLSPKPSPEKRTSPRKNSENKVYIDFLTGESTSEESEDDVDPATFKGPVDSDSDDESVEAEGATSSSDDEDDDEDEDADCGDEDAQEDEDDEMLKDYQEPGYDSGATAVSAFAKWEGNRLHLWVANAGDSRCIVSRNGIALEMSEDHKPEDEREALRIVTAGGKVTSEGRVNGGLNLSRAIGDHSYKTNPTLPLQEQMITSLPDVEYAELNPETDRFIVLACDGIWNSMTSQEVIDFVSTRITDPKTKLSQICEELFRACLALDTGGDGTGCDNMTAIIVRINNQEAKVTSKEIEGAKLEDSNSVDATVSGMVIEEQNCPKISGLKRTLNGSPDTGEENKRLKLDEPESEAV